MLDFGRKTPKFSFEFCCGCFGGFYFLLFCSKEKGQKIHQKIHQKIPRKIHLAICPKKIPLGFLQKPFLENLRPSSTKKSLDISISV